MKTKNPVILIIRDGWGYRKEKKDNLIAMANTPWNDYYKENYPDTLLNASGEAVGVPKGYQGNSEVGHMTIGSGRIIFQSLVKINKSIENKKFFKNKAFLEVIDKCKKNNSKLHIAGLLQTQGVHSHIDHLFALLDLCKKEKFYNVLIHVFTDGRDAPVTESLKHVKRLEKKIKEIGFGSIVSVSGRYFAMDRNEKYSRTKKTYDCIVNTKGKKFIDITEYIKNSHSKDETDEFIKPACHKEYEGINENDGFIFFNFRTDRPRQLTRALIDKKFNFFERVRKPKLNFAAMTKYYKPFPGLVAFEEENLKNILGEYLADNKYKQLRISETEKYAHVTFFFNGQREKAFKGEKRILIPSPNLATYDLKPEMSAPEISRDLCKEVKKEIYDLIVVNLVNCDMVGHTADYEAIKKAVEAVDRATGDIVNTGLEHNYTSLIIADHGNAEDKSKKYSTSHTTNKIPAILVSNDKKLFNVKLKSNKGLKDVSPTVLKIMKLKKPKEMTGSSIF
ncbi:MAG: 2,3-bisphosphoglycerate-independent phosphoglycerate mutase [Patescibacteria group bacterium]|jgi:2,3-bisphosphoglycerate-independent phosphoglycerate mutase|nr:2,3-bisphosphoglycerate-independent phosphoglycerate mutase [Patescibacteria group bacterium]